jgi:hypothetical protein
MKKSVNVLVYAIKYTLKKMLDKSLTEDNEAIKNGAKLTFEKYAKIKQVECTRKDYTTEAKAKIEEFAKANNLQKVETKYIRIEVDNIDNTAIETAKEVFNTLENSDNKNIAKVASKIAR